LKKAIAKILLNEGYVKRVECDDSGPQGSIKVTLKYFEDKRKGLTGIRRVSKPGRRMYAQKAELPRVLKGLGTAIISTSRGVVTDKEARRLNVGGEVLAFVW
jgi:small subunit ribosomal protein S8